MGEALVPMSGGADKIYTYTNLTPTTKVVNIDGTNYDIPALDFPDGLTWGDLKQFLLMSNYVNPMNNKVEYGYRKNPATGKLEELYNYTIGWQVVPENKDSILVARQPSSDENYVVLQYADDTAAAIFTA